MTKVFMTTLLFFLSPIWSEASKLRGEQHAMKDRVSRKLMKGGTSKSAAATVTPAPPMSPVLQDCQASFASEWAECQIKFCDIEKAIADGWSTGDFSTTSTEANHMLTSGFFEEARGFAQCVRDEGDADAGEDMLHELENYQKCLEYIIAVCSSNMGEMEKMIKLFTDLTNGGQSMTNYVADANGCLTTNCHLGYLQCD